MRWIVTVMCMLAAAPAAAQSTYVGASLVGDLARFDRVEAPELPRIGTVPDSSIDGETLGFGLTAGRALGEQWGVELEFVRAGEIEHRGTRLAAIPTTIPPTFTPGLPGSLPVPGPIPIPFPPFAFEQRTELQHTTLGALVWVRHDVGDWMQLSYLGGITFIRTQLEREIAITDPRLAIFIPIPLETKAIEYQAGPAVGVDASFNVGDHVAIVTGVRLHALTAESRRGWLIRPAASVRWRF